MHLKSKL